MKNAVEKFEQMLTMTESWFDDFHNKMKNTLNVGYQRNKSVQDVMKKHDKDLESGTECKGISKGPNKLFFSNVGGASALIGKNRNQVDDMGDLKISKRELRCYDLEQDKYQIAWLFDDNAKFQAKKIWGGPGEIHFEGVWEGGIFKGVWHGQPENFKASVQSFQGTGWSPNMLNQNTPQVQTGQIQPNQPQLTTIAPQPISYLLWLNNTHTPKTLPQVIDMLATGQISADTTQIFRDGINKDRQYVILSRLPEYPQINSAVQKLISQRAAGNQ